MCASPTGDLWLAVGDTAQGAMLRIFNSTDGGASWDPVTSISMGVEWDYVGHIEMVYNATTFPPRLHISAIVTTSSDTNYSIRVTTLPLAQGAVHTFSDVYSLTIPQITNTPSLHIDSAGVLHLAFASVSSNIQESGTSYQVQVLYSRSINNGVSFASPASITSYESFEGISSGFRNLPMVDVSGVDLVAGGTLLAMAMADVNGSSHARLRISRSYDDGDTWETPQPLPSTVDDEYFPQIAVAPDGAMVVVYASAGEPGIGVQKVKYISYDGTNWFLPQTLSNPGYAANSHAVASHGNRFFTIFTRDGGIHYAEGISANPYFGASVQIGAPVRDNEFWDHSMFMSLAVNPAQTLDRYPVAAWSWRNPLPGNEVVPARLTAASFWDTPACIPGVLLDTVLSD